MYTALGFTFEANFSKYEVSVSKSWTFVAEASMVEQVIDSLASDMAADAWNSGHKKFSFEIARHGIRKGLRRFRYID